ncbi:MAG: lipoate--protein ligase [Flavobacteriales bacterium]|nr:lipoate--protein ligase [Bacteroidota bacterium]MCB9239987.1 lipoate--protein ligase [Flavobacteriales bacterium]
MKLIHSSSRDVYFNLALEEVLLHHSDDDYVVIYANEDAVVLGKHQNAFAECRITRCEKMNVHVARRLSGGGTVFHGSGNINFCFIRTLQEDEPLVDFKRNLEPVILFLRSLGLPAEFSGRNDLLIHGFKISGNAEHVYQRKRRLIHHGTLLFHANLHRLKATTEEKSTVSFESHAVQSVRSTVANIIDYLSESTTEVGFTQQLMRYLANYFGAEICELTDQQVEQTQTLVLEKYRTWEWIYGYSPAFRMISDQGSIRVRKGHIEEVVGFEGIEPGKPLNRSTLEGIAGMTEKLLDDWY